MMLQLILLSTLYLLGHASASELTPISLSSASQSDGLLYTVRYRSTRQATVVWETANFIHNSSTARMTHSFTDGEDGEGQGEAAFLSLIPTSHLMVRLFLPGELSLYYYDVEGMDGETTLPDLDLVFPNGQNIVYNPGSPFTIPIQYSRHQPEGYSEPELKWYFMGVDNNRVDPILELAASWDPNIERFVSMRNKTIKGDKYEVSAEVNLESQEGIVSFIFGYNGRAMRLETLYISQQGSLGPLPSGFIGIFDPSELWGYQITCSPSGCILYCNGVGSGVNRVDLRKSGSGSAMVPALVNPTEWMYITEYNLAPKVPSSETYICTAYNSAGSTSKEIRVRFKS